eukprot:1161622-Pelagomonas_calceolata.AAC.5
MKIRAMQVSVHREKSKAQQGVPEGEGGGEGTGDEDQGCAGRKNKAQQGVPEGEGGGEGAGDEDQDCAGECPQGERIKRSKEFLKEQEEEKALEMKTRAVQGHAGKCISEELPRAKCRWQALRAIASKAMSIDLASVLLCTSLNVNVNDDAHAHCCRAKCWWQAWPWAIACKAMFIDLASVLLCTSLNVNDDAQVPAE